jgi:hypothetical protein
MQRGKHGFAFPCRLRIFYLFIALLRLPSSFVLSQMLPRRCAGGLVPSEDVPDGEDPNFDLVAALGSGFTGKNLAMAGRGTWSPPDVERPGLLLGWMPVL